MKSKSPVILTQIHSLLYNPMRETSLNHFRSLGSLARDIASYKRLKNQTQAGKVGSSRPDSRADNISSLPGPSSSRPEPQQQTSEYEECTDVYNEFRISQNKENRRPNEQQRAPSDPSKSNTSRRGMYKEHSNGVRVTWNEDSQGFPLDDDELPQSRNNKRKTPPPYQARVDDDDNDSEPYFEVDQRTPKPDSRKRKATEPLQEEDESEDEGFSNERNKPKSQAHPSKRIKTVESVRAENSRNRLSRGHQPFLQSDNDDNDNDDNEDEVERQPASQQLSQQRNEFQNGDEGEDDEDEVERQPASQQQQQQQRRERSRSHQTAPRSQNRSRRHRTVEPDDDEGSLQLPVDDHPRSISFSQTQVDARSAAQEARIGNMSQTRTFWSKHDEEHLIDLIRKWGTSWAKIERKGEFQRDNITQISLKDKARNIKASYLM